MLSKEQKLKEFMWFYILEKKAFHPWYRLRKNRIEFIWKKTVAISKVYNIFSTRKLINLSYKEKYRELMFI